MTKKKILAQLETNNGDIYELRDRINRLEDKLEEYKFLSGIVMGETNVYAVSYAMIKEHRGYKTPYQEIAISQLRIEAINEKHAEYKWEQYLEKVLRLHSHLYSITDVKKIPSLDEMGKIKEEVEND